MTAPAPAAYDKPVLYAVRAMFEGKASEAQQRRFMEWLIFNACHVGVLSFDSGSERMSAFLDGERSIGLQLVRLREPAALAAIEPKKQKPVREAKI